MGNYISILGITLLSIILLSGMGFAFEDAYAAAPVISSVSFSPGDGNTEKVGDTITMTINADAAGYAASAISINDGVDVTTSNFQDLGLGVYSVDYVIAEGDTDIHDLLGQILVSVVLDNAGTTNVPFTTSPTAATSPGIDAHSPTYTVSVTPSSGVVGIGGSVVVTLTAGDAESDLAAFGPQTINGIPSLFSHTTGGVYLITYNPVTAGDGDASDAAPLPVSITLKDTANNN